MKVLLSLIIGIGLKCIHVNAKSDCTELPQVDEDEDCCASPDITDRVILRQCEEEGERKWLFNGTMSCFVTACYMERVGFMDNGQISLNKVRRYIDTQEYLVDPLWRDSFKEAATTCFQRTYNQNVDEIRQRVGDLLQIDFFECDPLYIFYSTCIQSEIVKKCPKEAFNGTPSCRTITAFLNDCPDYLLTISDIGM